MGSSCCSRICEIAFLDTTPTGGEHPGTPLSLPILRRGVEVTMYAVLCLLWQTQRDRIFALTVRMLVTLRAFVRHAALVVR
jgi:hypothetical protein